jgi:flagellar basal body P-ring formation protein FlgA
MIRIAAVVLLCISVARASEPVAGFATSEALRTVSSAQVRQVVQEYLEQKTSNLREEVEIVVRSVPDRITWRGEKLVLQVEENPAMRLRGPTTVVVNLMVDGQVQNRVVTSAVIRTFAEVLVAARRLGRHSVLGPDDVRQMRMETTFLQRAPMSSGDSLSGLRTKRIVTAGSLLYEDMLEPQPLVFVGDDVSITVSSGAVRLSTRAVAEEDGWKGDVITVRREGNRAAVKARVEGTGSVAIGSAGKEQP